LSAHLAVETFRCVMFLNAPGGVIHQVEIDDVEIVIIKIDDNFTLKVLDRILEANPEQKIIIITQSSLNGPLPEGNILGVFKEPFPEAELFKLVQKNL